MFSIMNGETWKRHREVLFFFNPTLDIILRVLGFSILPLKEVKKYSDFAIGIYKC